MTAGRDAGQGGDRPAVIDRYLAQLDRHLAISPRYRLRVLAEAADHLSEAAEAHQADSGADASAAEAVRRFGPADRLAAEINAGWDSARARRAPVFAFLAGAGVLAAAATGIPTIPGPAGPDGGAPVTLFATVAFLALQLALMAGAVALLRVLARRSAPVLPPADRTVAWRAARLCVAATAVAGAGFLGVGAVQAHGSGTGANRLAVAAFGMLAVLAPAAWAFRRLRPAGDPPLAGSPQEVSADFGVSTAGPVERLARLAEQAVAIARAWPGPVTALLAGFCAAGSYAHAETGRPGSVLAAVVEATGVVVFARIFGPRLELRAGPKSPGAPCGRSTVSR